MSELIDREATVKQICKMGEMVGGHDRDVAISIALFVQDDKSAFPTVEERPHGEWVKDINMDKATVCSECGEEAWYKEYCGWVTKSNFCPNCGADMRAGDEK